MRPRSPDHYDVVIVGARAAGAATAMLLARSGLQVLVVDRGRYGADTLSTHALMRGGVLQLQRWGLLDAIVDAGTPAVRRTTFHYGKEEVVITIKPSLGVDALYAPRRTVLDPLLVDAAVAAGAEVHHGMAAARLHRSGDGRVVGVDVRRADGSTFAVSTDLVIGADGVRSTTAERVGAPIERTGVGASAVIYGHWSGLETDGYEWIFQPGAAAGVIPTNDGQACVFVGSTPERIGSGGAAVMQELLPQASPDLARRMARLTPPPAVRTFTGRPGFLRRAWGEGWALVGDAGYWKDPLSAHGLTDALRDAELLARAVIATAGRSASERDDALRQYQQTRDSLSMRLFDTVDEIAMQQWSEVEIGGLLLQMSSAMADEVEALAALDAAVLS